MKTHKLFAATLLVFFACLACPASAAGVAGATVTMDWVTVGDVNNPADPATGYGSVGYEYKIGKHEVTLGQYTEFLNAAAKSDPHELYHPQMFLNTNIGGIRQSLSPGSFSYSVIGSPNRPVTYVTWFDAARMANWMHNGQGSGSTETGVYNLLGATAGVHFLAEPGALFRLPTENEWYKAAYYSGNADNYWLYPTQSNEVPGNVVGGAPNQANTRYGPNDIFSVSQSSQNSGQNCLTDVGAFTGSASHYGTFDQGGNVSEWNDAVSGDYLHGSRFVRGTGWRGIEGGMRSSNRTDLPPGWTNETVGFRLATIPEPATATLAALGVLGFVWRRRNH